MNAEEAVALHDDLVDLAHVDAVDGVADDGAAHLVADDGLLDRYLVVEREGRGERLLVARLVGRLRDADRRAAASRLHEDGEAAAGLHGCQGLGHGGAAVEDLALGRADAGGSGEAVARVLVHAHGAREHAAADVGDAAGLERALEGAVLPALAVEDGQRHVDGQRLYAAVVDNKEAAGLLAHTGDERDLLDIVGVPPAGHVGGVARVVEPLALLRDADERELEATGKRADYVVGGLAGDVVLGRDSAKENRDLDHGGTFLRH